MEDIGKIEVQSSTGAFVPIGELWTEHPIVLVFVRHFG